jgi:hypothetical protein
MGVKKSVCTGMPVQTRAQKNITNIPIVVKRNPSSALASNSSRYKSFMTNMMRYTNKNTIERVSYGQTRKRKINLSNTNLNRKANKTNSQNEFKRSFIEHNSIEILKNKLRVCMTQLETLKRTIRNYNL